MVELDRRDLLGSMAVGGILAGLGSSLNQGVREQFKDLKEKVEERRSYRKNNPGGTVYLGSVNRANIVEPDGTATPKPGNDIDTIDKLLEEGNSPREILGKEYNSVEYNDSAVFDYFEEGHLPIELVHLNNDGSNRPLKTYEKTLQESLDQLLEGINVEVSTKSVDPDQKDINRMENVSGSGKKSLDADLGLKEKYASEGQEPIFLSEKEIFSEGGHADYLTGVSWVELSKNEKWNQSVINHEGGHSTIFLPHTYSRKGVMSYNAKSGESTDFNTRSEMAAERIMKGGLEAEAEDMRVMGFRNGESYDATVKKIDYRIEPGNVDEERNSEEATDHFGTVLEDMFDFQTDEWEIKHNIDETKDRDVYRILNKDGYQAEFEVDKYIEDVKLYDSEGRKI